MVEKSGTRLVRLLQKNDPFKKKSCRDAQWCMVCRGENGNGEEGGDCRESGVTYKIRCLGQKEGNPEEQCGEPYHGETDRNGYTRGREHDTDLTNERECSVLWKHCVEKHGSVKQRFEMVMVDRARNDATKRQILEAVRIQRAGYRTNFERKRGMESQPSPKSDDWGQFENVTSGIGR